MYEFIDDLDCDTGMVTYKGVTEGERLFNWYGVIMTCISMQALVPKSGVDVMHQSVIGW